MCGVFLQVGAATAPQHKVVGARVVWKLGTLQWPGAGLQGTQAKVPLTSTVTFASLDQGEASLLARSTPPLLPSVPKDFMYPFLTGSSSSAALSVLVMTAVALAVALGAL